MEKVYKSLPPQMCISEKYFLTYSHLSIIPVAIYPRYPTTEGTYRTAMALASLESHHSEVLSEPPPLLESVAGRKYHCPLCLSSPSLQYPVMSKSWRLLRSLVWLVHSGTAERMYPICCIFNCQGAWGNYKFIPLLISTERACFWSMFSKKFYFFHTTTKTRP